MNDDTCLSSSCLIVSFVATCTDETRWINGGTPIFLSKSRTQVSAFFTLFFFALTLLISLSRHPHSFHSSHTHFPRRHFWWWMGKGWWSSAALPTGFFSIYWQFFQRYNPHIPRFDGSIGLIQLSTAQELGCFLGDAQLLISSITSLKSCTNVSVFLLIVYLL